MGLQKTGLVRNGVRPGRGSFHEAHCFEYAVIHAKFSAPANQVSDFPQRDFWGVSEISFDFITTARIAEGTQFAKQKETFIAPEYILTLCRGWRTCLAEPVGMLAQHLDV